MKRHSPLCLCLFVMLLPLAGCRTPTVTQPRPPPPLISRMYRVTPRVAVMDFENRANFTGKWKLGEGMADVLTTELLDTERVTVLERKNLDDIVSEIVRQGRDLFRKEGRVEAGRLKNARYLIRGVITDFTVTGDASGWFAIPHIRLGGGGSKARTALTIRVSDVETGEIISSVRADGAASSGWFGGEVDYKKVSFGGDAFFRTPLGHATEKAVAKAVKQILRDLPTTYWEPRVAEAGPDSLVINGGANVRLSVGDVFLVRGEGRTITDPITGNVIEEVPGRVVGKIQVQKVKPTSAHAVYLEGEARRGHFLEPVVRARRTAP